MVQPDSAVNLPTGALPYHQLQQTDVVIKRFPAPRPHRVHESLLGGVAQGPQVQILGPSPETAETHPGEESSNTAGPENPGEADSGARTTSVEPAGLGGAGLSGGGPGHSRCGTVEVGAHPPSHGTGPQLQERTGRLCSGREQRGRIYTGVGGQGPGSDIPGGLRDGCGQQWAGKPSR